MGLNEVTQEVLLILHTLDGELFHSNLAYSSGKEIVMHEIRIHAACMTKHDSIETKFQLVLQGFDKWSIALRYTVQASIHFVKSSQWIRSDTAGRSRWKRGLSRIHITLIFLS